MVEDKRGSNETRSGSVEYPSADAGTTKDLVTVRSEATFSVDNITISYATAGTNEATVELYDEPEGTPSGDLGDRVAGFFINPGDFMDLKDRSFGDIEDDLVVLVSGNDDVVNINGEGYLTTG